MESGRKTRPSRVTKLCISIRIRSLFHLHVANLKKKLFCAQFFQGNCTNVSYFFLLNLFLLLNSANSLSYIFFMNFCLESNFSLQTLFLYLSVAHLDFRIRKVLSLAFPHNSTTFYLGSCNTKVNVDENSAIVERYSRLKINLLKY